MAFNDKECVLGAECGQRESSGLLLSDATVRPGDITVNNVVCSSWLLGRLCRLVITHASPTRRLLTWLFTRLQQSQKPRNHFQKSPDDTPTRPGSIVLGLCFIIENSRRS